MFLSFLEGANRTSGAVQLAEGIITRLLDFNTHKLDDSIGPLLDGLKTAFITRMSGMFLSIVFKAVVTSDVLKRPELEKDE